MKKVTKKSLMLLLKGVFAIALFSVIVLNMYSVKATDQKNYSTFNFDQLEETNKEKWEEYCRLSFNDQGKKDQEECYKRLRDTLKDFYEELYKLLATYQNDDLYINDQVILWTVFFSQFDTPTTGNDPYTVNNNNSNLNPFEQWAKNYFGFNLDGSKGEGVSTKPDYSNINYYAQETDTLKILIRNCVAYTTTCYGVVGDVTYVTASDGTKNATCPSGGSPTYNLHGEASPVCADNIETYNMGFWKYFLSKIAHDEDLGIFAIVRFLGFSYNDENYDACHEYDSTYPEGVHYVYNEDPKVDYNMYFDFLKENAYFDNKANLQYYFNDVLVLADVDCLKNDVCENSLEAKGEEEYHKYQEMLEYDRLEIIYDILEILDAYNIGIQYGSYNPKSDLIPGNHDYNRKAYYWPIGSDETTEKNGVIFADGEPASTTVKSYFGERTNEVTGKKEMHYGIDIEGQNGVTNVIAVEKGEVITVVDSCSPGDYECNEGYGNEIIISHPDGNFTVYASLASIDPAVTVGSTVLKGQLIGKVGQTGRTKSADLHFELREGGNSITHAVNPTKLLSASEPRPSGYGGGDFSMHSTSLTKEEFVTGMKNYCNRGGCGGSLSYFAQHADTIYDVSVSNGLNPEFTVVRAINEGFSPGSSRNNYWGIGCTNTGGLAACKSYSSFESGIKGLANLGIVRKYDSALEVFTKGHYAYIGSYWYNPGSSSKGGCYYFPYIKEYYTDTSRIPVVENACAAGRSCTDAGCTKTNDADQEAYGYYQIRTMTKSRYNIWGLN